MAVLELFARSTGAGVVAGRVAPGAWVAFDKAVARGACGGRRIGAGHGAFKLALGGLLLGLKLADELLLLFGRQGLDARKLACHIHPQAVEHRFEQLKAFGLVFVQRVALGVATKAHD